MTTPLALADVGTPAPSIVKPEHRLERLIRLVRAEYQEMPGLYLSVAQARRLWSLDAETCTSVLDALLADRFLVCTPNGDYRRFDAV